VKLYKLYEPIKYFILLWMSLVAVLSSLHYFYNFDEMHLIINHWNNAFFDLFFKYFTYIGDAATLIIIILVFLFVRYRDSINLSLMLILSTIFAQSLKHIVNLPRPYYFFTEINPSYLHLVDGVKLHNFYSFPSGHTTSAFVLFTFLAIRYFPNKIFGQLLMLFLACLVGFSRVYLSQHFLHDVLGGSFLGILSVFLILLWTINWKNPKWNNSLLKK